MPVDWTDAISARSLSRGMDYYESGAVLSLEMQNGSWRSVVDGTTAYAVTIPESMDPHRSTCTCPHYADGNICKHIAAVMFAIDDRVAEQAAPQDGGKTGGQLDAAAVGSGASADVRAAAPAGGHASAPSSAPESIADIVARVDAGEIKAFLVDAAERDESLERALRASFGIADAAQAKRDLRKATTNLMRRYERSGFIDWRHAMDFQTDYSEAVSSIVEPLVRAGEPAALVELAIVRLVQLQRICIDDSDGFFTDALADVVAHLDVAFERSDRAQRERMLAALVDFAAVNPGKDRGDVYWFEQDTVEDYVADRFAGDPQTAPKALELAEDRLAALPPAPEAGHDSRSYERRRWSIACLKARSAMGASPDELIELAEGADVIDVADVLFAIVDAQCASGRSREAIDLLAGHLGAKGLRGPTNYARRSPRPVDRLLEIASSELSEEDLMVLYATLLLRSHGYDIREDDYALWYDRLRILAGGVWAGLRAKLLVDMPTSTACLCLAREGAAEELFTRIMADGGHLLSRYEDMLVDTHPEPYVDYYLESAADEMERARDRRGYRHVAADLAHAAGIDGGRVRAAKLAHDIMRDNPRRTALHDELRKAGF